MSRNCVLVMMTALFLVSCKGETREIDRPETLSKLTACTDAARQKDTELAALRSEVAQLKMQAGTSPPADELAEVIVNVSDSGLKITGGAGPHTRTREVGGDAKDAELYAAFLKGVNRSRGGIKKCYQRALKGNTSLQARTITLAIEVKYRVTGQVQKATFSPTLSDAFDQCMAAVTKTWELPAPPRPVTFNTNLSLTPQ